MNQKAQTILGLDLGSNSVGWALATAEGAKPRGIIGIGARVFNKAVEDKNPAPKNQQRRAARLARRVVQRRARRRQRTRNLLISAGLLPESLRDNLTGKRGEGGKTPEAILNGIGDPYQLREKALAGRLESFELGRVLFHLSARRGFLSNKKHFAGDLRDDPQAAVIVEEADEKSADADEGKMKGEIKILREKMGDKTLGEYLHNRAPDDDKSGRVNKRNRQHRGGDLRADRAMYEHEFGKIRDAQAQYFSGLTDRFWDGISKTLFYQRPLKLREDRVGKCSLEKGKTRAAIVRLEFQEFRMLQSVNNIRYLNGATGLPEGLNLGMREKALGHLAEKGEMSAGSMKKLLGMTAPLNVEPPADIGGKHNDAKVIGNRTASKIIKVLGGDKWRGYGAAKQKALVEDLLTIKKKSALKRRLMGNWQLDAETAVGLCLLEFEPGHSNLSLKAINKILPHLREGEVYSEARIKAGYGYEREESPALDNLPPPPETRNPIVNRGLHELRRVVNAVIAKYGKPDIIRLEMARDLEMNTGRYRAHIKQQNENKRANEKAAQCYRDAGRGDNPSREDKIKYRLWCDQGQGQPGQVVGHCVYSGRPIGMEALFSAEVEIDHILPRSKWLDDSYMNKVVCYAEENRNKGDRTPFEAWRGDEEKWEQIIQRLDRWGWAKRLNSKYKRFFMTAAQAEAEGRDFAAAQLNDTRYIAREALAYLQQLGCKVEPTKGGVTAKLRHWWGVNQLLGGEQNAKDRSDHRHHAVDAAVIACTDKGWYERVIRAEARIADKRGENLQEPYPGFYAELEKCVDGVVVSHDVVRKASGALHEETGAGYVKTHGATVYRKPVGEITTVKQARKIVDAAVRDSVVNHLQTHQSGADFVLHKDGKTPIYRVRVVQAKTTPGKLRKEKFAVKDRNGRVFKYMPYGSLHHMAVFQNIQNPEVFEGIPVPMMLAAQRIRGIGMPKQNAVQKDREGWRFVMALHKNDLVSVKCEGGGRVYYRVRKLGGVGGQNLFLTLHSHATPAEKDEEPLQIKGDIPLLMSEKYDLRMHKINAIGGILS